jgi:hypothetical protein
VTETPETPALPGPQDQPLFSPSETPTTTRPVLEYKVIQLSSMTPAPYNPREISDEAEARLEESMTRWGLVENVVWNKRSGFIVGGFRRYRQLQKQGATEAMTCIVDLNDEDEKLLNLTLNNPEAQGRWSVDKLRQMLEDQKLADKKGRYKKLGLEALEKSLPLFEKSPEFDAGEGTGNLPMDADAEKAAAAAKSNIRMVNLFLTTETQPEFIACVQKLAPALGVDNITDCVFLLVKRAAEALAGSEDVPPPESDPAISEVSTGGTIEVEREEVATSTT